ncbi:MAG: redox-sensing transcriptional repressor Rex [Oscillospiraceae bacterium]
MAKRETVVISRLALARLPYYLQYLKQLAARGIRLVSAPAIAEYFQYNEVQVRKDLAAVSTTRGRPKTGFEVRALIRDMEDFLGYNNADDAVLVGVGALGRALLSYKGFEEYGLTVVAAFETDPAKIGQELESVKILPFSSLAGLCRRLKVPIGIVAVPAGQAQPVCDALVEGGVRAIWNFAPVHLTAPPAVLVQNENMAASLAMLCKHLQAGAKQNQ